MAKWSLWDKAVTNNMLAFASLKKKLVADLEHNEQSIIKYACPQSGGYYPPILVAIEHETIKTKLGYVERILLVLIQGWVSDGILQRHELEILEAGLKPFLSEGDIWVLEEFYWMENIIDPDDPDCEGFREWVRYVDRLIQKLLAAVYIFRRIDFRQRCRIFIHSLFNKADDNSGADALVLLFQERPSFNLLNYHQHEKECRFNKIYYPFT